jgi:hypothetical protein
MTTWDPRANELFLKALELGSAGERQEYLDGACAGDGALRAEVEALLQASVRAGNFLESPATAPVVTTDWPGVSERPGTVIGRTSCWSRLAKAASASSSWRNSSSRSAARWR